jgi:hypothetical protein
MVPCVDVCGAVVVVLVVGIRQGPLNIGRELGLAAPSPQRVVDVNTRADVSIVPKQYLTTLGLLNVTL